MSLATLARKSSILHSHITSPSSRSPNGFSLNGTHRNQGYIGQTSLSRSLPRTLMKGNTPRGHGGCCGKYIVSHIVQSGVISQEDSSVVKKSSLNTSGLIRTKYRWMRRPQPFTSVKTVEQTPTQSDYLNYIRQKILTAKNPDDDTKLCNGDEDEILEISYNKCTTLERGQVTDLCPRSKIVKPDKYTGAITGNEYIYKLNKRCIPIDDFKRYRNINGAPTLCSKEEF